MIIASPAKKELAIQLQLLQPSSSSAKDDSSSIISSNNETDGSLCYIPHEYSLDARQDVVSFKSRDKDSQKDFVATVFGRASQIDSQVDELMLISTPIHGRTVECQAFIHNQTVFLSSPVVGNDSSGWGDGDFQSCITHLIELAEEKTGCEYLVIAIDRRSLESNSNTILRAFMYLGFQMIDPSVYGQESGFILVGYEL